MSSSIDLSRIPPPDLIEETDFETIQAGFVARFKARWGLARSKKPTLPDYDVELLETDPAIIVGQAASELRLLDRIRVNDVALAVLAPTSTGADLDNVAARLGVVRPIITPADPATGTAAVKMEDDVFRQFYLDSFDRFSAGSAGGYRYEARKAWPALGDVSVVGRAIHGRRGDTDVVVMGPAGRIPTDEELALVSAAIRRDGFKPEAVAVLAKKSIRVGFSASLRIFISNGPAPETVRLEALRRVTAAAAERTKIGGEIPAGFLRGAAFGPSVIDVDDLAPVAIAPDPYSHPAPNAIEVLVEVRP